ATPSSSPGRGDRVVAETDSSSAGIRSRNPRISVPLPTPDGPVMTITRAVGAVAMIFCYPPAEGISAEAHQRHKLGALALREAADRLARRDLALREDLVDLHTTVLRNREQEVKNLGGLEVVRRFEQQLVDRLASGFQIALQLRPAAANIVR